MPFSFHEDFSVRDERDRSYQIDIEENSALSNGHARITDKGQYHLTLNGNRHFLAVPALRNFRLKLDAALVIHSLEFGCGFLLYFRHDRHTGAGQVLKAFWDTDFTFTLSVNKSWIELPIAVMPPKYASNPKATGHSGVDYAMLDAFFNAIREGGPSPVSLKEGLRMSLPGTFAAESARKGGELVRIKYPWSE